jgi:hypothetical protein
VLASWNVGVDFTYIGLKSTVKARIRVRSPVFSVTFVGPVKGRKERSVEPPLFLHVCNARVNNGEENNLSA